MHLLDRPKNTNDKPYGTISIGGVSEQPYATLNLGHTVGDDLPAVEENHRRALGVLGWRPGETVSPYQVHSARVGVVQRAHVGTVLPDTDALLTNVPGVPLLMRFADCSSVFFFDLVKRVVGIAHAGWRGAFHRRQSLRERAEFEFAEQIGHLCSVVRVRLAGVKIKLDGRIPFDPAQLPAQEGHLSFSLQLGSETCLYGVEVLVGAF